MIKKSIYWHTKAAEQGDASSQSHLGGMFYLGQGTTKDNVMAYAWSNIAAAQGHVKAKRNRGLIEKK
jgi:TPR repeat protein